MNIKYLTLLLPAILIIGCSTPTPPERAAIPQGDTHWTLEFTLLKNNKPTEIKTYQFESRTDCFNTMYKMQEAAKKTKNQTGAGLCFKLFADGQERTSNDALARQ
ncbi:MAG: hypothetical protein RJB21_593 [Pseudomonadota bacterium]|jgi:hypothetical protein